MDVRNRVTASTLPAFVAGVEGATTPGRCALQQLGVELCRLEVPEHRQYVEADQVVVALSGGVLEFGHVEPLLDRLADGDRGLRVLVLVDLLPQARGRVLRRLVGRRSLQAVPLLVRQRVAAGVDAGAVPARGEQLDVAAWTP